MNPFKMIDEFLLGFSFSEEVRFLLQIPIWFVILFFMWVFSYFLAPWVLIGGIFFILIPLGLSVGVVFFYRKDEVRPRLVFLSVFVFLIFLICYGVSPESYDGVLFHFLRSKIGQKVYWGGLDKWWDFHNYINPFSNYDYPNGFYGYKYKTAKILLWLSGVVLTPLFTALRISNYREEAQLEHQKLVDKWEKEFKEEERLKKKKLEDEKWRIEQEKELEVLAKKEEVKKQRERASKSTNPWDSGFF